MLSLKKATTSLQIDESAIVILSIITILLVPVQHSKNYHMSADHKQTDLRLKKYPWYTRYRTAESPSARMVKSANGFKGRLQALFDAMDKKVHMPCHCRSQMSSERVSGERSNGMSWNFVPPLAQSLTNQIKNSRDCRLSGE